MDWERMQTAISLKDSGRFDDALAEYCELSKLASTADENVAALTGKLNCLLHLGRVEEARKCLTNIKEFLPGTTDPEFHVNVKFVESCTLESEGLIQEALNLLNEMITDDSDLLNLAENRDLYEEVQVRRAILLLGLDQLRKAKPLFEEALSFETDLREVHYGLGVCYFDMKDNRKAQEHFLTALKSELQRTLEGRARYYLGIIYCKDGRYAKAKLEFELAETMALESSLSKKHIYDWLVETCRALGLHSEAKRYAQLKAAHKS